MATSSAKCAEGSGSTPPPPNALFLLGQLSSLTTDETACLLPLSFTLNQLTLAKAEQPPAAAEWEGQMMIAGWQNNKSLPLHLLLLVFQVSKVKT